MDSKRQSDHFQRVLETLRALSSDELDKGKRFERLTAAVLRTAPQWATKFSNVWLWEDWPGNEGKPDTGIDLVAEDRQTGELTAIQAKFYKESASLTLDDVGSYFGLLGQERFTDGMIVSTTPPTRNLRDTSGAHAKHVAILGSADLAISGIDWSLWTPEKANEVKRSTRKPRPHQKDAIGKVLVGFEASDRGKLIMACGTGKTYTGQQITEQMVGVGGLALVLLPSISLLSQTIKEWAAYSSIPMTPFAVCSDSKAGRRVNDEDISPFDLVVPPTTDAQQLVAAVDRLPEGHMGVIFSTYHSTPVITEAQQTGLRDFGLVIADEAHRTTGQTLVDGDDSNFVRVHDDEYVRADKRLYMTATPRVYSDGSKAKAAAEDAYLASMDNEDDYGPEFHRLGFREAVDRGLLTDYRVLVLAVDEGSVASTFQQLISDENNDLNLEGATKLTGVLNALAKRDPQGRAFREDDTIPMQTALAFSNTIDASKQFAASMSELADQYDQATDTGQNLTVELDHVDGSHNAIEREAKLTWLADDVGQDRIRILSNAKCLTEGVDVPSLDSVIFLEPRNSMVDVIQAVGRVMRLSEGKERGYVILPIGIPAGTTPSEALANHNQYKVVWQVLNALRSHDERLNAVVNQLDLNNEPPDMVDVQGSSLGSKTELDTGGDETDYTDQARQLVLGFPIDEVRQSIYAQMVAKVGTRHYWEDWANDIAAIAQRHETRIKALINDNNEIAERFTTFVEGLRSVLNDSVDADDAISMLSQHLITRPVFEALFSEYDFIGSNPVSKSMQDMIDLLDEHALDKETETLEKFYLDVAKRAEGIDNAAGKQRIVTELYERFFAKALPKTADALGIVYTPIQVVDFILGAADNALRKHFNTSISDEGVHVLDPFGGTGTFMVRLLQSGLIKTHDLARKYANELHTNEILLLAYYIAAINIEATYHDQAEIDAYEPFPGIVYTDTFQLIEDANTIFGNNSERARKQQALPIQVIVGNPPYSMGQGSANDNNANRKYPAIDARISETYKALSTATRKTALDDSYIRSIRWASDRVISNPAGGVMAYVTNGGYIDGKATDGLRLAIADEFHHLYIYNLRGDQRTAGERSRKEGGKVFGAGSRASVAIVIAVRQPGPVPKSGAALHYRDIGDYLSTKQKLDILAGEAAEAELLDLIEWQAIAPNKFGDWINHRSENFSQHDPICDADDPDTIFLVQSNGLLTARDAWNYNSSRTKLEGNTTQMLSFFNSEVDRFKAANPNLTGSQGEKIEFAKEFFGELDLTKFSWDDRDFSTLVKGEHHDVDLDSSVFTALYRPFHRRHVNAASHLNSRRYQLPKVYPTPASRNLSIWFPRPGSKAPPFAALISDTMADNGLYASSATVTVPLSRWLGDDEGSDASGRPSLFDQSEDDSGWSSNISPIALGRYQQLDKSITDEDVFFYVYGMLHSPSYRTAFAADLKKMLPRIPRPVNADQFWAFAKAGRDLAHLHVDFEDVAPWPGLDVQLAEGFDPAHTDSWRVEKMRHPKVVDPDTKRKEDDLSTVVYNSQVTITGIPERAHDYVLGYRSAIDWVLDRHRVKTESKSQITNDPNDWGLEHDNPTYIYDLLRSVVTVSMRTLDIIDDLPELDL